MAKKKPSVLEKAGDIFKEEEKELTGELFDVNAGKGMVRIKIDKLIPNPNQPRKTFFEQTISSRLCNAGRCRKETLKHTL